MYKRQDHTQAIFHYEKALRYFETGLQKKPHHIYLLDEAARVHFNLADLSPKEAKGHWQQVVGHFRIVLSHFDADKLKVNHRVESAAFLGLAYSKTKDYAQAELLLDTLKITTDNWLIPYIQSCHYCLKYYSDKQNSDLDLALAYFKRAVKGSPEAIAQAIADQDKDLKPLKKNSQFQMILQKEQKA